MAPLLLSYGKALYELAFSQPGVMGKEVSAAEESFEADLLEYPHYTRPREWEGRAIPEVLLSGDHARIAAWRRAEAERITSERRPDLTNG